MDCSNGLYDGAHAVFGLQISDDAARGTHRDIILKLGPVALKESKQRETGL